MLMKYRDKRKQEECMQYTGENILELSEWAGDYCTVDEYSNVLIEDYYGKDKVCEEGDFVIYDSNNGFSVISRGTFLTDFCIVEEK